ncbi:hypothetical protein DPEC_G00186180 [Dallia pectoralis]|uniref:Uncharacterized protein n=1 Tax=Dallia pectoralis TaxID=75939 RepID=A0ACC2GBI2_DALPE|nr:hypothetical protein DPEC_G00186180 [Dallia pectoralis]
MFRSLVFSFCKALIWLCRVLPRAHASSDAWIPVSEPSSERLSGTTEEVNVTDDDSEPWVPLSGQQGN